MSISINLYKNVSTQIIFNQLLSPSLNPCLHILPSSTFLNFLQFLSSYLKIYQVALRWGTVRRPRFVEMLNIIEMSLIYLKLIYDFQLNSRKSSSVSAILTHILPQSHTPTDFCSGCSDCLQKQAYIAQFTLSRGVLFALTV